MTMALTGKRKSISKPEQHSKRIMLCVGCDMKCIFYHEMLNQHDIINAENYYHQQEALHQNLHEKSLAFVNCKGMLLLHDTATVTHEKIIAVCIKRYKSFASHSLFP